MELLSLEFAELANAQQTLELPSRRPVRMGLVPGAGGADAVAMYTVWHRGDEDTHRNGAQPSPHSRHEVCFLPQRQLGQGHSPLEFVVAVEQGALLIEFSS